MMAGVFDHPVPVETPECEWNIRCDVEAASLVYRTTTAAEHISIGLDVTLQVEMAAAEVRRRFTAPLLRPVVDFAEVWFRDRDRITFHDPLAAVQIFHPETCRLEAGHVTVDWDSPERGRTRWQAEQNGPHQTATAVDPEAFFHHYFAPFTN